MNSSFSECICRLDPAFFLLRLPAYVTSRCVSANVHSVFTFAELLLQPLRHAPFLKALFNALEYLRLIPPLPPTSPFYFPLLITSSKVQHEVPHSSSFSASGVWNCCLPVQKSSSGRTLKPALFGRLR